ncbi:hypothetical protein Clacol_006729 [Clathrus columnatus]|uniref:[histone H3]-dimethyl-L-lysine(36) demethylase n=1 Tax=Clathrus columnatus TaxID=1419009 RepID=A0AAV5AFH6_9AGAM|nr:hypothetical protein Clacol_006729 [Clathrus columnatus]
MLVPNTFIHDRIKRAVVIRYCQPCREANPTLKPTFKPPTRKSSRKRTQLDYANLHAGLDPSTHDDNKWLRVIEVKDIKNDNFRRMKGSEITIEWLEQDQEAFKEPIVIEHPDGLGMRMPPKGFTVADVAESIGPETPLEVIDVSTQSTSPNWTLGKWAEYYSLPPNSRDKIRNVISLEFSNTPLVHQVSPPRIVKELDWVEKFWPANKRGPGQPYPKVQMYCLMSVAQAWTIFYFARPTAANLNAYERWSGTDMQTTTWLGDMVDEVLKVELVEGNTVQRNDSHINAELRVRDIEIATHVPKKFRFPLFSRLCWYVGEKFLRDLKAHEEFPQRILESLVALADFLVSEARIIESRFNSAANIEAIRKEAKDAVPVDKVKDASALARELRWRVRNALGLSSDDENTSKKTKSSGISAYNRGVKRKRESVDIGEHSEKGEIMQTQSFRNWVPPGWDKETHVPRQTIKEVRQLDRPIFNENEKELENWADDWINKGDQANGIRTEEVSVETTTDIIVKIRRIQSDTGDVMERQRVERKLEVFRWPKKDSIESVDCEDKPKVQSLESDNLIDEVKVEEGAESVTKN